MPPQKSVSFPATGGLSLDRVKFVVLLVLLALLLGVGSVASAVGAVGVPPTGGSVSTRHLLLQAQDVAELGTTHVMSPDSPSSEPVGTGVLRGWEEARVTAFLLDIENAKESALIISNSYKFASPKSAQAAVQSVQDPTWMALRPKGTSLLNPALALSLSSRSDAWGIWKGIDRESLLTYLIIVQSGSGVARIQMSVMPNREPFAQRLVNQMVEKICSGKVGAIPGTGASGDQLEVNPLWWAVGAIANHWEYPVVDGEQHNLAVWSASDGTDAHYLGPAGDSATCVSTSGCISNWTWWLKYPESKLGVPKSFLLLQGWAGANDIHNYSATVWLT